MRFGLNNWVNRGGGLDGCRTQDGEQTDRTPFWQTSSLPWGRWENNDGSLPEFGFY